MTFGEFLRSKREERSISCRQLAKELGVSIVFLSDVERGNRGSFYDMQMLEQIRLLLSLTDNDYITLLNLSGKQRNTIAPDILSYVRDRDYVSSALRVARDLNANEGDWNMFIKELTSNNE